MKIDKTGRKPELTGIGSAIPKGLRSLNYTDIGKTPALGHKIINFFKSKKSL